MGEKWKDFSDFRKAAELMKAKKHLTKDGSDQIIKIKKGMNQGRKVTSAARFGYIYRSIYIAKTNI